MDLELLSLDFDARLQTYCVTARSTYRWFLNATRGAERNLQIQRQIIKGTRAYQTLRADLRRGCVLPPLVCCGISAHSSWNSLAAFAG